MEIIVSHKTYKVNPDDIGGILTWLKEDQLDCVPLPIQTDLDFNLFLNTTDCTALTHKQLVQAFKIAHYLNSLSKMELFGKAIARIIESSSYDEIKQMSTYFSE